MRCSTSTVDRILFGALRDRANRASSADGSKPHAIDVDLTANQR
jgi:hypothetical protein